MDLQRSLLNSVNRNKIISHVAAFAAFAAVAYVALSTSQTEIPAEQNIAQALEIVVSDVAQDLIEPVQP